MDHVLRVLRRKGLQIAQLNAKNIEKIPNTLMNSFQNALKRRWMVRHITYADAEMYQKNELHKKQKSIQSFSIKYLKISTKELIEKLISWYMLICTTMYPFHTINNWLEYYLLLSTPFVCFLFCFCHRVKSAFVCSNSNTAITAIKYHSLFRYLFVYLTTQFVHIFKKKKKPKHWLRSACCQLFNKQ